VFDRAQCDDVEGFANLFGTSGFDFDVREGECTNNFTKEYAFLLMGLDEGDVKLRIIELRPEFNWETGESGAGSDVC